MYIDTALAIVGLLFRSMDSFIGHLAQTSANLAAQGKKLAFKPHPAHDLAFLASRLEGTGVELVSNQQFLPKLRECCACIAETTSVALMPALMGMPLLYAQYGELEEQRFGTILTSYPRGYALTDVSHLTEILARDAKGVDRKAVDDWIAFNSGPLPAEDMPDRVAQIVEGLVREREALAV
jgi:hypothetical protein